MMEEPELAVLPKSPADPWELSWAQLTEMGIGDLGAQQQFGLSNSMAPQLPLQMEDYLAHNYAMMDRQFCDADLAKWIAELPKSSGSSPSPLSEMNIHHQMELEAMDLELQLLWTGPSNEKHLDQCIGVFDHCSQQMETQFNSLNVRDDEAGDKGIDNNDDLDIEDYMDPSMLGCFFPNSSLGHGKRGPRRTSRSAQVVEFNPNFGLQEPSTNGGRKHGSRKNNDHWTQDEVRLLVNGVSEYGVGKWTDMKTKYFLTSIRTPVHLKDKWKNLVKACKKENGRMLLPLEESLIERIMEIDDDYHYPKQSNSVPGCRRLLAPLTSPDLLSVLAPAPRWSVVKARSKRASVHKSKKN